jgi:uncharacterized protein (DUF427 family)
MDQVSRTYPSYGVRHDGRSTCRSRSRLPSDDRGDRSRRTSAAASAATFGGEQIFDTTRARYVWEWPYYPQYYIPADDIDMRFLVDEHHEQRLRQGTARRHGLRAGGLDRPGTMRVFGDDAINGVAGTARFNWDALDAWYEEDEQVFVHPRNPYVRVYALRSHRRVRASRSTAMKSAFAPLARSEVTTACPRAALRPPTST